MAKILFGNGVANMSGKQAGTVYSKNANGAYTRNNRKGVNPNTIRQQVVRASFRAASRYYGSLIQVSQDSFKDMAINYPFVDRMGNTVTYTGSQLAAKLANICRSVGVDPIQQSCPAPIILDSVVGGEVYATSPSNVITTLNADIVIRDEEGMPTSNLTRTSERMVIEATAILGNGINAPKKNQFRRIAVIGSGTSFNPADIHPYYEANFGLAVPIGIHQIFFKFSIVNTTTPQASTAYMIKTVVTGV